MRSWKQETWRFKRRNEAITVGGYSTRTQIFDLSITVDTSTPLCANVASAIHTLVGIVTNAVDPNIGTTPTRTVAPGSMVGEVTLRSQEMVMDSKWVI